MAKNLREREYIYWLKDVRCPCSCGGEGQVILLICPECELIVGACGEIDTILPDLERLNATPVEEASLKDLCKDCEQTQYDEFLYAIPSEFERTGITREQVTEMHNGINYFDAST